ncbi:MAG: hypothetical protein ACE5K4_12405 [Candidatus Hydrothermarchaeota archaeon]
MIRTLLNGKTSLNIDLFDKEEASRGSHYPFIHLDYFVPTREVNKIVLSEYEFSFVDLTLFMNAMTELHNHYCELVRERWLIDYFLERDIGRVGA